MNKFSIYIVDDEQTIREGIAMAIEDSYLVTAFATAEDALKSLAEFPPDLILLDIGLPGISGIEALQKIKAEQPDIPVVMITAYEDIHTVISAMKSGAYDYVLKPLHMDALEVTISNALETVRLRKEVQALQEQQLREHIPCFIAASDAIQDVMSFVKTVAQSPDTPVLIVGETGTGKELLAAAIHYYSPNFKAPLTTVNCAAIPKDLIESELFGYEKGAFSGAGAAGKKGLIEQAAGGTLFLDEIGDLSQEAQAKMLRFLEQGEFYRVGGTRKIHIATRVVSATNKNIEQLIDLGQFRKDLYFRLGVIKVQVPALNERPDDILPLANYFLQEYSKKFSKNFSRISVAAQKALLTHNWTGNVRELKNLLEAAVLVGKGPELSADSLGFNARNPGIQSPPSREGLALPQLPAAGIDLTQKLQAIEKHYIGQAMVIAEGNESKAARLLNLNHHTFRYRRKKLFRE
jgi:two-component system response regulator AtoC